MEERALFSVMIPHLSFHPHAFISLPTYFMSPTCSPSPSPSFSLPLSFSLSFSTDNRQSSHAVHLFRLWRRPSESAKPCFSAEISLSPFSIFLQPACSSSLPSVIVYCSEYHSFYCSLTGLPGLQSLFPDIISLLRIFSLFSLSSVSF